MLVIYVNYVYENNAGLRRESSVGWCGSVVGPSVWFTSRVVWVQLKAIQHVQKRDEYLDINRYLHGIFEQI